ncbi:MAG: hypothetical protein WBO35_03260 [Candidatus Saccharimonadales bacterium]|jgi:hypothetical protein
MNIKTNVFGRSVTAAMALALLVGTASPALLGPKAFAAQVQTRSIKMSDSTPGASGVTYQLSFMNSPTATQELVIEFCTDTPLVGATCDTTDTTHLPTLTGAAVSAGTLTTPATNQLQVKGLTISASSTFTLDFTGVVNPTYTGTFYARLVTFDGVNDSDAYTGGATTGSYNDYGGFALSTVQQVTITARVMETLTFCVSGEPIDNVTAGSDAVVRSGCVQAQTPAVDIGSGTPKVLSAAQIDADSAWTQLSTNATGGAIIRMKATNACANAGLSSTGGAACSIPGLPGSATNGSVASAMTPGTAAFGLFVADSTATTGVANSTGALVLGDANYNDGTNINTASPSSLFYGMDRQSGTGAQGVMTVYGDPIAASTGPVSQENNELVFAATASLTTPAGIYTGNEILIATGTF